MADTEKEIDLISLTIRVLHFLKKYILLYVILIVIGLIYGYLKPRTKSAYYKATLWAQSDYFSEPLIASNIDNLKLRLEEGNFEQLSRELNIPLEKVKLIKRINAETSSEADPKIIITIETDDSTVFPNLEKGILYSIENNPYVKNRIQSVKAIKENQLKTMSRFSPFNTETSTEINGSQKGMWLINPADYSERMAKVNEEIVKLQPLFIIDKYYNRYPVVQAASLKTNLIIGGVMSLFLALFLSVIIEFAKIVRSRKE